MTGAQSSPKNLRSAGTPIEKRDVKSCIICEGYDQSKLCKVVTDNLDANLKSWAAANNNFQLLGKLMTQAADDHTGVTYYHVQRYLHLRDSVRAGNHRASTGPAPPKFDTIATAQIVTLIEDSVSVFKLSELRQIYQTLMVEQGSPCHDNREPHSHGLKSICSNFILNGQSFHKGRKSLFLTIQRLQTCLPKLTTLKLAKTRLYYSCVQQ